MRSYFSRGACALVVLGLAYSARAIEPKYLPPNAETAITVNLKQMLGSPLFKDKKELVEFAKGFLTGKLETTPIKGYLDKAEFDIFKDLHSITFTSDGGKETSEMFIAIEGNFKTEKWIDVAKEVAAENGDLIRVTKTAAATIFQITPIENGPPLFAAIMADSVLVGAPTRDALNATITRVKTGRGAGIKGTFKTLLETTNNTQCFSMVVSDKGLAKMAENAPQQAAGGNAMLAGLEGMSFSVTITKDITFQLAGTAKDEATAKQMATLANTGIGVGRGLVNQKAKDDDKLQSVADIMSTFKISTQGSNVILRGSITRDTIDNILSFLPLP